MGGGQEERVSHMELGWAPALTVGGYKMQGALVVVQGSYRYGDRLAQHCEMDADTWDIVLWDLVG